MITILLYIVWLNHFYTLKTLFNYPQHFLTPTSSFAYSLNLINLACSIDLLWSICRLSALKPRISSPSSVPVA